MSNERRCSLCGLWACEHIKGSENTTKNENLVSIGESIGEEIWAPPYPARVRVATNRTAKEEDDNTIYKPSSTIPMGATVEAKKVIIPPPPKVGVSSPIIDINVGKDNNLWVNCSICKARVLVKYLDEHQKVHIHTHSASRAIVKVNDSSTNVSSSINVSSSSIVHSTQSRDTKPKLAPIECYKFRPIETACAASSMSQDGRYSDFTVIFWMNEKIAVSTTNYAGGSNSSTYRDWERLAVHVVYDGREDYYTVTTKLLKRRSFSSWDDEENIPDRICLTPHELGEEIKKALLFFCISPKVAYKKFRKVLKGEVKIDYDSNNRACIAQTKNCGELFERMKKSSSSSTGSGYGYHGHEWAGD